MPAPRLIGWSRDAAALFGLAAPADPAGAEARVLTGTELLAGMKPYAACYGGHQFGNWAGQLGDGRAISLGEAPSLGGSTFEFQLKGAGRTPYSRRGDGRAVLRSSIREFVCSEAMHHLGVPTTRALSVSVTGEEVVRDMFYDGNARPEIGAVVCRLSPSFVRFGNFEIFASRGEKDILRRLADFVIERHFPELKTTGEEKYAAWFAEVVKRTAHLMNEWMRVGFVHGVMNTDNLSILGLTIDYGPYGWLENYDPLWTPNTTDLPGRRYAYGRQPAVAHWNLGMLARALSVLIPDQVPALQAALDAYEELYADGFVRTMGVKLGIEGLGEEDHPLLVDLEELLLAGETDMTLFYRGLSAYDLGAREEKALPAFLVRAFYATPAPELAERWLAWLALYRARASRNNPDLAARAQIMNRANPLYVPRNYLLQEAIERAERGDYQRLEELMEVLRRPYEEQSGKEAFAAKRPDWARDRPGCSTLSCSS